MVNDTMLHENKSSAHKSPKMPGLVFQRQHLVMTRFDSVGKSCSSLIEKNTKYNTQSTTHNTHTQHTHKHTEAVISYSRTGIQHK